MGSASSATLAALVPLAALAACGGASSPAPTPPPQVTVRSLGAVHVAQGRLVDGYGRELTLRGANVKTEGLFDVSFSDGRKPTEVVPPWDPTDGPELALRGFDFVRLCISWSGLEPEEGHLDDAYLARLDQVIADLEAAGVYVLIDFHEDAWSKEIGEDGAPAWAILPAPAPRLSGPIAGGPGLDGPYENLDDRRTAPVTLAAFTSFFENTDDLQTRFYPAWRALGARYAGRAAVIGLENMNEPMASQVDDGVTKLYAFHDESIRQLRGVDPGHPVWVEPEVVLQNFLNRSAPRTLDPVDENVVWAPHLYPRFGAEVDTYDEFHDALATVLSDMVDTAASWHAATVIGEYWARLGEPVSDAYVDALQDLADVNHVGLAIWHWRGYRNPGAYEGDADGGVGLIYDWDYLAGHWYLNRPGFEALARPYALALPGRIDTQAFDRQTGVYTASFDNAGGEAAPLVYLPEHRFPGGVIVELDGAPVEVTIDPASRRALVPWDGAAGHHTLLLAPR